MSFDHLSFNDFKRMAKDNSLSRYEKIGFPDSYRKEKEELIFQDIVGKLPLLSAKNKIVLDIGPGCSELPFLLIDLCRVNGHTLILVDSEEMLSHLPDEPFIKKIAGYYPCCKDLFDEYRARIDVILTYSVLHCVFFESNMWDFLDRSLELMAHGGEMLIGDIPNESKRKRFFSCPTRIQFHQGFAEGQEVPEVVFNKSEPPLIDDEVVLSILARVRNKGVDAYLLPQRDDLPMANRREDILIKRI